MDLLVELSNIIRAFNEDEIDYALCGGLALAVLLLKPNYLGIVEL